MVSLCINSKIDTFLHHFITYRMFLFFWAYQIFWVVTPISDKNGMLSGLNLSLSTTEEGWQTAKARAVLSPFAVSQHAICLSQVNIESYEHSTHTNTSLQNTLPTMPFSKHLCLWPSTLPCHLIWSTAWFYFGLKTRASWEKLVSCVVYVSVSVYVLRRMLWSSHSAWGGVGVFILAHMLTFPSDKGTFFWATPDKHDSFCYFLMSCKIFHLDKMVFLYVSIGERGSTHQATSYLVNSVPVSLGWVMSSLDSPGWETGMLQRADWGKGLWAGCCVCVFFNMWNEETMEGRLCSCLCMCTPVCLCACMGALLQHCCVKTCLCTGQLSAGECVDRLYIHSKLTKLNKSTTHFEAQTHVQ